MKKLITKISCCFLTVFGIANLAMAQESSTSSAALGRITIIPYVPEQIENLPAGAENMLLNKLKQIVTENGVSGENYEANSRFIITPNIDVATKDVLSTAPSMTALTLNVNLYIGDGYDGKKYASQTLSISGVGINETKAYIDAIKNIKPTDTGIQKFVATGKTKIIDYYNGRCTQIINEANNFAAQSNYAGALYTLNFVPTDCTECYNKVQAVAASVFKKYIERECKLLMAEANSKWNANQSWETANEVATILARIDPEASCYKDALALNDKIGKRVLEIDKREWNYVMERDINLERDRINAWRDVGVAYGKGQAKNVVFKSIW